MIKFSLEKYLNELETLVNIDSGFGNPDGASAVGDWFVDAFDRAGWMTSKHSVSPKAGDCVVVQNRMADHYDVMLVGHMDTVFPAGEAAKRPFRRDKDRAYGVGVLDMKQGCLAMYYVLVMMPQKVLDKLNIVAIFNPDEEIGSPYSTPLIDSYAAISDYAFIFEAASTDGSHCIERKGRMDLSYEFYGTSGHAGFVFENNAASAVNELAYWIVELNKLQSEETGTMVNAGVIKGGSARNIVADYAETHLNIRYDNVEEMEKVKELIEVLKQHAAEARIVVEEKIVNVWSPLIADERTKKYAERMKAISESLNIPFKCKKRGGCSDANHIAAFGPVCVDGMGPTGDFDHSDREYIEISTIEPNIDFAAALICDLAGVERDDRGAGK